LGEFSNHHHYFKVGNKLNRIPSAIGIESAKRLVGDAGEAIYKPIAFTIPSFFCTEAWVQKLSPTPPIIPLG